MTAQDKSCPEGMQGSPDAYQRKLALSDDILMKIEKPARYIGGKSMP